MEKAKIRPLAVPKPINRPSPIGRRDYVMDGKRMQNFVAIGSGVSAPQIRHFTVLLG